MALIQTSKKWARELPSTKNRKYVAMCVHCTVYSVHFTQCTWEIERIYTCTKANSIFVNLIYRLIWHLTSVNDIWRLASEHHMPQKMWWDVSWIVWPPWMQAQYKNAVLSLVHALRVKWIFWLNILPLYWSEPMTHVV